MPNTPYLGLPQVAPNQQQKEVTINAAIIALESAISGTLTLAAFDGTNVRTLSATEFTRSYIFVAGTATADATLKLPATVNEVPSQRIFAVRNKSGFGLTVVSATAGDAAIVIPDGESRLLAMADNNVFVAAEPGTAVSFLALTDTPNSYTGKGGQVLVVAEGEDGLELVALATTLAGMLDVDVSTPPTNGQTLVWNTVASKWEPGTISTGAASFLGLTDTPDSYTGAANQFFRVNGTGTGVEFIAVLQVPTGGTTGQVLTKGAGSAYAWADAASGTGVPTGGTTGQVLAKASATNGDTTWTTLVKQTEVIIIALSDETTAITTGVAKVTLRMPYAFTLTAVRASLTVASSSGIPTIDIKESGTTILSTKLTINVGQKTSTTATTAVVISDTALANDAEMTFNIDVSGVGATGLKIYLIGHQ